MRVYGTDEDPARAVAVETRGEGGIQNIIYRKIKRHDATRENLLMSQSFKGLGWDLASLRGDKWSQAIFFLFAEYNFGVLTLTFLQN